MNEKNSGNLIVGAVAIVAVSAVLFWLISGIAVTIEPRIPGMDNEQVSASAGSPTGPDGELILAGGIPAEMTGEWPNFRGSDLDNISKVVFKPIPKGQGFKELWALDVGEGFAGVAIKDGRVYLMDYDRENKKDAIRCLSLADGKEIWRYTYPVNIKRNHGMSRTVPVVTDEFVITIGPKCHVTCLDPISGEKKWSLDMVYVFGTEVPPWYAGQCPLVIDNQLILAPGGTALVAAIDTNTGDILWETPNPNEWKMTHSSVVPMNYTGTQMYVYCASGGVVGVAADDGRILWETPDWIIRMANVPSPLVIGDGRLFFCGGYKAGSMMIRLEEEDGAIIPKTLFKLEQKTFGAIQHTPILYKEHIYGVRPDGQLICLDLDGNVQWNSTPTYQFGSGPYMLIGSTLYVLNDVGLLTRVEVASNAFKMIDQTQVLHGHESWAPIAFASGRMIVRDLTKMVCIQVASN